MDPECSCGLVRGCWPGDDPHEEKPVQLRQERQRLIPALARIRDVNARLQPCQPLIEQDGRQLIEG